MRETRRAQRGMQRVWTYWEGPQPDWIGLCLDTIRRNIPGVEVLDRKAWHAMWPAEDVPREVFDRLPPNAQSDFVRAWLLYHVGGIWVDADCIVFRDVRPLAEGLGECFAAYQAVGTRSEWCTALLASEAGSPIGELYLGNMLSILESGGIPRRNALGPKCLWPALAAYPDLVREIPADLVHPYPYWLQEDPDALSREGSDKALAGLVRPDAYCFMLTHRSLGPLVGASREELLASRTLPAVCWWRALMAGNSKHRGTEGTE